MNAVYRSVMLSNPLDDEERYRALIDAAIVEGEVEAYKAYTEESAKRKEQRMQMARREGKEAKEYAKKLGVEDKLFGNGDDKSAGTGKKAGDEGLAALIQQRQKGRAEELFDKLEAKYAGGGDGGGGKAKSKNNKKRPSETALDEPPEEAFQKTAERAAKNKKARHSLDLDDPKENKTKARAQPESNGTQKSKRVKK